MRKYLALYLISRLPTDEINSHVINDSESFSGGTAAEDRENDSFHGNAFAEAFVQQTL